MKIKSIILGAALLVLLFGGIWFADMQGWWNTHSRGGRGHNGHEESSVEYYPADIRGSYTFADVATIFGIPLETLAVAFMLPADIDPQSFRNQDLEELYAQVLEGDLEIGNASVQLFVALYKNLSYEIEEDIYLPAPAVWILTNELSLTEDQTAYLQAHTLIFDPPTPGQYQQYSPEDALGEETHGTETTLIKGNTTFFDLLQWGVDKDAVEQVIGAEITNTAMPIHDYCTQNGLSYSVIKSELQLLIDAQLIE